MEPADADDALPKGVPYMKNIPTSLMAVALVVIALCSVIDIHGDNPAVIHYGEVLRIVSRVEITDQSHEQAFLVQAGEGPYHLVHFDNGSIFGRGYTPDYLLAQGDGGPITYVPIEAVPTKIVP